MKNANLIPTNKITALYERLSRDDEAAGDSVSIQAQKILLEDYARQNNFVPFEHYTDDGWSGGNFERPRWKDLIADIEAGKVGTVIVKDMSRVGREYLQTGYYTEIFFPQNHVRFIAVTNNIDSSDRSSGDIAPFLNLINDFYLGLSVVALGLVIWLVVLLVKDPQGKVRSVLRQKKVTG